MTRSKRLKNLPEQFFAKLASRVTQAIAEGRDIINLGQGNPDRPTPQHIIKAMQEATADPTMHKYSPFRGITPFKEAIAAFYKREYNVDIDTQTEIAILFGAKSGLVELPLTILDPGDTMLLPDPGYPDYLSSVALADIKFETMPLLADHHFLPDYAALDDAVIEAAKLMYINYPNNPTGAVATPAFFDETIEFAKKNNITVMHDFAYASLGFDGQRPISFLQSDGAKEVGIEFYTLSKTYNMAGWRVGFAVGNAALIEGLNLLQDHLYCSIFPAIQIASAVALTDSQQCVVDQLAVYEQRRNVLITACQRIGWAVNAPEGSFFAWLKVPEGYTSEGFADYLLDEVNIAVAAGNGFGKFGEGYIRVGLLVEESRLLEAVERISSLPEFSTNLSVQ
ncbi:pyridoxal phosphate-dependent aminotransferase [Kurthia sibirica]|uniref:LL-diaminopimelate aminotransferase n=1 Tax=Kurthia sibirica TaxID=202750 RepID=A0A2U3APQ8_9BACL|nr:pyridoxal phosphate-dependent aminotransferase [Kurthia sibirica]PWI26521.1 LL-diaminopimelate aminotransferase [Kurthia sibirica]GEK32765.1 aminotransferase [Kurthia sibirica]